MPYVFPTAGLLARAARPGCRPRVHARAGRYCYDTMTLVGPGTWEAARAAVDAALTAVDLVWRARPVSRTRCAGRPVTTRRGSASAAPAT